MTGRRAFVLDAAGMKALLGAWNLALAEPERREHARRAFEATLTADDGVLERVTDALFHAVQPQLDEWLTARGNGDA